MLLVNCAPHKNRRGEKQGNAPGLTADALPAAQSWLKVKKGKSSPNVMKEWKERFGRPQAEWVAVIQAPQLPHKSPFVISDDGNHREFGR